MCQVTFFFIILNINGALQAIGLALLVNRCIIFDIDMFYAAF